MISRWRVAARIAWREVRHRPGRTVLVALLVALPVGAVTTVTTITRTTATTEARARDAELGRADDVVTAMGPAATATPEARDAFRAAVRDAYPAGTHIVDFGRAPDAVVTPGGGLEQVETSDRPLNEPLLGRSIVLTGGRAPERPGEVAVSRSVLDAADANVGDRVRLFLGGTAEVTGTVVDRDYTDRTLVVSTEEPPSHLDGARVAFVDTPGRGHFAGNPSVLGRIGAAMAGPVDETTFSYRADDLRQQIIGDYLAVGVALAVTAIVAAAAFAVGTRRQIRTLGLLGAAGASPADLRRTVLLQGTAVGLVGSAAGAALGLAVAAGAYPVLDDLFDRRLDGFRMHPLDLVMAAVLGTAAATCACWVPARSAGRIPVLSALGGRRPQGRLHWAVPGVGAVALALGVMALGAWARRDDVSRDWGWGLTAALVVLAGGTAIAPWLVTHAEPLAARLRGGGRLAARGLARQRLRSGAVVAAMMAPAGLTVFGATAAVTEQARERQESVATGIYRLGDDEVQVHQRGGDADEVLDAVRAALPGATEVTAHVAAAPSTPRSAGQLVLVGQGSPPAAMSTPREIHVITADQLRRLGAPATIVQALEDGRVVVFGEAPDAPQLALDALPVTLDHDDLVVDRTSRVPNGDTVAYVSPGTAERWGAVTLGATTLFRAPEPLTPRQQRAIQAATNSAGESWLRRYLRDAAATMTEPDVTLGAWYGQPASDDTAALRWAAVGASLVFTLLVAALALTLTGSESADERGLLDAIGAPPSVRRSSMAWQATLLPAMAVGLAVPVGLIGAYAVKRANHPGTPLEIPWATVAAVLIGLPLVTGAITWLAAAVTGRRRRDLSSLALADD